MAQQQERLGAVARPQSLVPNSCSCPRLRNEQSLHRGDRRAVTWVLSAGRRTCSSGQVAVSAGVLDLELTELDDPALAFLRHAWDRQVRARDVVAGAGGALRTDR